jgi:hypothetical protein
VGAVQHSDMVERDAIDCGGSGLGWSSPSTRGGVPAAKARDTPAGLLISLAAGVAGHLGIHRSEIVWRMSNATKRPAVASPSEERWRSCCKSTWGASGRLLRFHAGGGNATRVAGKAPSLSQRYVATPLPPVGEDCIRQKALRVSHRLLAEGKPSLRGRVGLSWKGR